MTLTSTRLGRLGAPRSSTPPRSPMCGQCTTDLYLKIRLFLPSARSRTRLAGVRRLVGRVVRSAGPSGGRVEYFCQKCGTPQRHQIPEGWEPGDRGLTPCDVEELSSVFITPGESMPTEDVQQRLMGPAETSQLPVVRAEKTRAVRRSSLLA